MNNHTRPHTPHPGPNCESFAPLLTLVGYERLDGRDARDLRTHLETCAYCQQELETYHWLDDALARHFGPAPRGPLSLADARAITSRDYQPRTPPPEPLAAPEPHSDQHPRRSGQPVHPEQPPRRPARSQRPQRGRRLISILSAVAAVLVIAAVSLALFASHSGQNGARTIATGTSAPAPTSPAATSTSSSTAISTSTANTPCTSQSGPIGAPNTPGATVTPVPFASWGSYTNTTYHFTLKYPVNWVLDNLTCPDSSYLAFWNYNYHGWQGPGFPPGAIKIELYVEDNSAGMSAMQFWQAEEQSDQQGVGGPPCPSFITQTLAVDGHDAVEGGCPSQSYFVFYIPDGSTMLRLAQDIAPNGQLSDVTMQMVNSLMFTS